MIRSLFQKAIPFTRSATGRYQYNHHLNWRYLVFLLGAISIYILIFFSVSNPTSLSSLSVNQIYFPTGLRSLFSFNSSSSVDQEDAVASGGRSKSKNKTKSNVITGSRIAVCLVGGARRFELTGPSIIDRVLRELPNSDLFLNSPLDVNAYKLSLLKTAPRLASIRIFKSVSLLEKGKRSSFLTADNSPRGKQGLLQYFRLVEGCLTLIEDYEAKHTFTYDWILRTRVDTYWSSPIKPRSFISGHYIVPIGSSYGGLNDRLGIGDRNTSIVALSRLSLISSLHSKGFRFLNSEASFKAQLTAHGVPFLTLDELPFCVVSDRKYKFPLDKFGVPVAAISSHGPLNGVKCRPCKPACVGSCVAKAMRQLKNKGSWTPWVDGRLQLCDARREWGDGWEEVFDRSVGKRLADARKIVDELKVEECVKDFEKMRMKVGGGGWDTPPVEAICRFGLSLKTNTTRMS